MLSTCAVNRSQQSEHSDICIPVKSKTVLFALKLHSPNAAIYSMWLIGLKEPLDKTCKVGEI